MSTSSSPGSAATKTALGRRAFTALVLLVGFYVLALVVIAAIFATNVAVVALSDRVYFQLIVPSLLVILATLRGIFAVRGDSRPTGVAAKRQTQAALWEVVDEVAEAMDTQPPDELILIDDVNAFVYEETALLGLIRRHRGMAIGIALLDALTVDQLRAVLAHEFGHYVGGDTRLGALTYRGALSLQRTIQNLQPGGVTTKVFTAYARLYWRVTSGVRRSQELTADLQAARVGGAEAARTALTEVEAAAAAYGFFVRNYVAPVWRRGRTPTNIYEGYRAFRDHPRRREEMDIVRAKAATVAESDAYDSHPPLGARLANLQSASDTRPHTGTALARTLLVDPEATEQAVSQHLTTEATGNMLDTLPWDTIPERVYAPLIQSEAAAVLAAVARIDGGAAPADLQRLRAVLDSGRSGELAAVYAGVPGDIPAQDRELLQRAALYSGLMAVAGTMNAEQDGARWSLSWTAPAAVTTASGDRLEVDMWVAPDEVDEERVRMVQSLVSGADAGDSWQPRGRSS
jgi:Zn-dependent protease with chaperone function